MEQNENYSCLDCIWQDQCQSDKPCAFFDMGKLDDELPSDYEIEKKIESDRAEYRKDYFKYVEEFN